MTGRAARDHHDDPNFTISGSPLAPPGPPQPLRGLYYTHHFFIAVYAAALWPVASSMSCHRLVPRSPIAWFA